MAKKKRINIGISCGDLSGIGIELILKTFSDSRMLDMCVPVIYAPEKAVELYKNRLKYKDFHYHRKNDAQKLNRKKINLVNTGGGDDAISPGKPTADSGKAAFKALEKAVQDLAATHIDVLVTAPIHKENIKAAGFAFPGHTEYLASFANEDNPLMILMRDTLRVGVVTGHIPLKEVSGALTTELILNKISKMNNSLLKDFACTKPKIAVLGLNPHAGENGVLGNEENEVISPAIEEAKKQDIYAFGPFPADGFFGSGAHHKYDGILAMYHDQGLAPFKALSFGGGVNFTAGLPVVRTSPDHGTAFDIAGKGIANENSFRTAVYAAIDIHANRSLFKEITADPLKVSPAGDHHKRDRR